MDSLKDRVKDIEKEAITNALEESNWVWQGQQENSA